MTIFNQVLKKEVKTIQKKFVLLTVGLKWY